MSARRLKIFISSVQKEFKELRQALKASLLGDLVLHRFIAEVFLFEDLPARDRFPVIKGTSFMLRTISEKSLFGTKPV